MPNECRNHVTITFPSEIKEELELDIKKMKIVIVQTGKNGVRFHITTAWIPDNAWLESLTKKYPTCWIKNEWISEDGKAGVWVAHKNHIKFMEWDDLSIEDEHFMFNSI
jgi:Ferredoxin-like domain in Api92-like protein